MKRQVKVTWNFVPKPPVPELMTLKNGQQIIKGVAHELRPEGLPNPISKKIYCYGCRRYFKSWHEALWAHGRCKQKPGSKMPEPVRKVEMKKKPEAKPRKNDKVPLPRGFQLYSVKQMEAWIREHRPEDFEQLFGRKL